MSLQFTKSASLRQVAKLASELFREAGCETRERIVLLIAFVA